jgi:hypothetical protein
MNTLTSNRILQKGDEYLDKGNWKAVPEKDFGIQVMFSKYSQVRRPSEPEHKQISPAPAVSPSRAAKAELSQVSAGKGEPISPDRAAIPAKAEGDSKPGPSRLGPGERLSPTRALLETVLHSAPPCTLTRPTETEKAITKAKRIGATNGDPLNIKFSPKDKTSWTGRNGTFGGYGLCMNRLGDTIAIEPVGKRGVGNCLIEFPVACIPQIISWLNKQPPEERKS